MVRLRAMALLAVLLAGCRTASVPEITLPAAIAVEHLRLNRCTGSKPKACTTDSECGRERCVSVLLSDSGAFGRDAGHTIAAGDRVLWLFGDSFTPGGILSATAAWSDRGDPMSLRDVRDASGSVAQILPFTAEELAYNRGHIKQPECCRQRADCPAESTYCHCPPAADCSTRVALWPGDGFAADRDRVVFYYEKHRIGAAPYDFRPLGTGLASLRYGDPRAARLEATAKKPAYLFSADEPQFSRGVRVDEEQGSFFYLYAFTNRSGCAVDVLSARVPLAGAPNRADYRFWNGSDWSERIEDAAPILRQIPGGLGSVGWNQHLQAYVSAWSDVCTGGNKLKLRAASRPQGPWSAAVDVDLAGLGADPQAYYGMWHQAFGRGRDLIVSYYQPQALLYGQIRLLRLQLP
ncbi:MAG TPA: DUF4185 domain-containing protein [Terriglobales bacterium]|nr:DUF4185 domain-containing protein [Terriglobales bacterium]